MKTPHAILIGLALIAAALFFREPSVPPAQAGLVDGASGLQCRQWQSLSGTECELLSGGAILAFSIYEFDAANDLGEMVRSIEFSPFSLSALA